MAMIHNFWSRTEVKRCELRHIWTINKFSLCRDDTEKSLDSPTFGTVNGPKWVMRLFPNGIRDDVRGHVSLQLCLFSLSGTACANIKYKFSLLDAEHRVIPINDVKFHDWKVNSPGRCHDGYSKCIKRSDLMGLLTCDILNVCCEIVICGDEIYNSSPSNTVTNTLSVPKVSPTPACTLSNDLESLFNCQTFGDFTIEVDGKEFLVYKGILHARSPVFAAMFQHATVEMEQNRVVIADLKHEVVKEMLIYIYTGRSPNLQSMASDLLHVADRYDLERLKIMAEGVLAKNLTAENAIEVLILADLYRARQLKLSVIKFVVANYTYFMGAVWENFVKSSLSKYPALISEVTRAIWKYQEPFFSSHYYSPTSPRFSPAPPLCKPTSPTYSRSKL